MSDPAFFGYGSLVNLATHSYADPRPAQLQGWRRIWRSTQLSSAAFLSIEPADDITIDGIVARVPGADWVALDTREIAYLRRDVTHQIDDTDAPTAAYQVNPEHHISHMKHPILRSYLDVVVQGYLTHFDTDGVAAFFETTTGWDHPVLDDRAAPIYPRHQVLRPSETAIVDHYITNLATVVKHL